MYLHATNILFKFLVFWFLADNHTPISTTADRCHMTFF